MNFKKWIDTFLAEKRVNLKETFTIEADKQTHIFDYGYIVQAIKTAPTQEQEAIKEMLTKIDFANGDVKHYLRYLAQALCKSEGNE